MSDPRDTLDRWRNGRAIGLRVSVLVASAVLATGLVLRLSAPLFSSSPTAQQLLTQGSGEADIDSSRTEPLFDRARLDPGVPLSACTDITLSGPYEAAPIGLVLDSAGLQAPLATQTTMTIDYGYGERRGPCETAPAAATIASGSLASVAADHGSDGAPLMTQPPAPGQNATWYRVTLSLPADVDQDLQGQVTDTFDLRWAIDQGDVSDRSIAELLLELAFGIIEHSVLPLLLLLSGGILFTGIQSRIDRRDPKLAVAPVVTGTLQFRPGVVTPD